MGARDLRARAADDAAIAAAHAIYTPSMLTIYDVLVHGLSNRFAWRCRTKRLIDLYRSHLSRNHLEAGTGTGFFLDRCNPAGFDRLMLLDINPNCLARSAQRLARYQPELCEANLLEPFRLPPPRFDSIGLTYILHCLPGRMGEKLAAVDHLKSSLADGGVLFGATILGAGISPNIPARALLAAYNAKGVFNNFEDDFASLSHGLRSRFSTVEIDREGFVARFVAR